MKMARAADDGHSEKATHTGHDLHINKIMDPTCIIIVLGT